MFTFAFFTAVFCSASWLIYAFMYIRMQLEGASLIEQSPENILIYIAVFLLPVLIIWIVFGHVNQYVINRAMNRKQNELLKQLQKNQDYTDLVVRVMLDAEHEIKDGFVLNKFDIFINDMNEALSEVIQRCNIASTSQLEQLWQRVRRGERWSLGKAVLDASKNQSTFDAWVGEKVSRDKVFRGSLLEFCSRYQSLLQLLEKHDRDRVFLNMVEAGVFGKVYSILAPLSEGLKPYDMQKTVEIQPSNDYASVLKIATIEEPLADETIKNVDRTEEDEDNEIIETPKESLFSRLNPFKHRKTEAYLSEDEAEDPFFKALHSSFQNKGDTLDKHDVTFSAPEEDLDIESEKTEIAQAENNADFGYSRSTLDSLRSANDSLAAKEETYVDVLHAEQDKQEPRLSSDNDDKEQQLEDEQDLAYPFGGWTDEKNYRQ